MTRLFKALWLVIRICIVGALAIFILQQQGQVSVTLNQHGAPIAYDIALPVVLGFLTIAVLLLLALMRLFDSAARLPGQIALKRERRRLTEGYHALTQSLVAIAAGDGTGAQKLAGQAAKKLGQPPLSLLIHAQAAQLKGDAGAAGRFFQQLAADPKAGFLGLRGQLMQEMQIALSTGQVEHARRLAADAETKEPRSPWVMQARFALEARARNWQAAEQVLLRGVRFDAFNKDETKWYHAALLLAQSTEAATRDEARRLAKRAFETCHALVPAALRYAETLVIAGRRNSATDVIGKAWERAPHPDLAAAWMKLSPESGVKNSGTPNNPLAQLKWLEKLLLLNDTDGEALLARADALLSAQLWGEARAVLTKLRQGAPDVRCYQLLARLEMEEKSDTNAAEKWRRAAESLSLPAWVCKNDGMRSDVWQPLCPNCGGFASARWTTGSSRIPALIAA